MKPEEIEAQLADLKGQYPKWWNYSDTLGERPIDGMIREILYQKEGARLLEAQRQKQEAAKQQRDQLYHRTPEFNQYQDEQLDSGRLPQGLML